MYHLATTPPPRGPSAPGLSYAVSSSSSLAVMCSGGAALVDECEPPNEICSPWTRCPIPHPHPPPPPSPPTTTILSREARDGEVNPPTVAARRLNGTTQLLIAPKQPRLQDNSGSLPVQSDHKCPVVFPGFAGCTNKALQLI